MIFFVWISIWTKIALEVRSLDKRRRFLSLEKARCLNCDLRLLTFRKRYQTSGTTLHRHEQEDVVKKLPKLILWKHYFPHAKINQQDIAPIHKSKEYFAKYLSWCPHSSAPLFIYNWMHMTENSCQEFWTEVQSVNVNWIDLKSKALLIGLSWTS